MDDSSLSFSSFLMVAERRTTEKSKIPFTVGAFPENGL
jgi:hypothetical protein